MTEKATRGLARAFLVATVVVIGGCTSATKGAERTGTTSTTTPPTRVSLSSGVATTTTMPATRTTAPLPADLSSPLEVARVVDGDTIKLSGGTTIRLIGMDTPETVDPRKPVQCFGIEASRHAHALLDGQTVRLEYDPSQGRFDKYGRTLAYLWMSDGRLYDEVMIREGYAHEYTYDTPYKYQARFRAAEAAAREASLGLWSPATCNGNTNTPVHLAPPTTAGSGRASACDPSYPTVCIPPPPPDLDCKDVSYRNFKVLAPDPHHFDGDHDGVGCES
jgi:micrococcal nuclease